MREKLYFIMSVLGTSLFAIIFHKCLPADANSANANSFLVEKFGFPVVAIFYFLVLFSMSALAIYKLGVKCDLSSKDVFLRFGIGYGLIYFVGMFEITPDIEWNMGVTLNQIFVGIGDAIPGILIAFLISRKLEKKSDEQVGSTAKLDLRLMGIVALCLFVGRMIGYKTGIVLNGMNQYFVPVLIWTILFSIIVGVVIGLLYPFYIRKSRFSIVRFLLSFGCNWLWFNGFIVLIMKNYLGAVCIRVAVDLILILLGVFLYRKITQNK